MTGSLTTYLTSIQEVFTAILGMFGDILDFVLSNPVLAIPAGISMLYLVINVVKGFIYGQN